MQLFDFEYVVPSRKLEEEVKYQYSKTDSAPEYKSDMDEVTRFKVENIAMSSQVCVTEK